MFKLFVLILMLKACSGNLINRSAERFTVRNATQKESPWLILIKISSKNLRCGGSLIKNKYVITAAHCFEDVTLTKETLKKEVQILIGEWKTDTETDCEELDDSCDNVAEIPAKSVTIHEMYKNKRIKNYKSNDIAIIQLSWAPRKTDLIKNIELTDSECDDDYENKILNMTGFGQIPSSGSKFTNIKKSITLKAQSHEYCQEHQPDKYLPEKHICALGTEGETTCSGDSGSGVTRIKYGKPYLEGMVVFGVSVCRDKNELSGILKIGCFKNWIEKTIKKLK